MIQSLQAFAEGYVPVAPLPEGAAAVGEATTRGVVSACLGCLVIDLLLSGLFQLVGV